MNTLRNQNIVRASVITAVSVAGALALGACKAGDPRNTDGAAPDIHVVFPNVTGPSDDLGAAPIAVPEDFRPAQHASDPTCISAISGVC